MLKCLCCKEKRKIGFPLGLSDHVNMTIYDNHIIDDFGSMDSNNFSVDGGRIVSM